MLALIATQKARRQLLPDTGQPVGKTLIVCPLSVMHNWIQQTAEHTPALSVLVFHGSGRKDFSQSDCDIVLTTYTIIASEATNTASVLLHENWGRVVFDEAHSLRNPNTKQTKAAFKLKVDGPTWMLTGTPIQNQIIDLWPLVKMIGVRFSLCRVPRAFVLQANSVLLASLRSLRVAILCCLKFNAKYNFLRVFGVL